MAVAQPCSPFHLLLSCESLVYPPLKYAPAHHIWHKLLLQLSRYPTREIDSVKDDRPEKNINFFQYSKMKYITSIDIRRLAVIFSVNPLCSHFTCPQKSGESGEGSALDGLCILGLASFQSRNWVNFKAVSYLKPPTFQPRFGYPITAGVLFHFIDLVELCDYLRMFNLVQSF